LNEIAYLTTRALVAKSSLPKLTESITEMVQREASPCHGRVQEDSLREAFTKAQRTIFGAHPGGNTGAWGHPPMSKEAVLCAIQNYTETLVGEYDVGGTKVIGFKEIRHATAESLDFFTTAFPCGRFILSTREPETQHQSQWHKGESIDIMQGQVDSIEQFAAQHPAKTFTMPLEDFSKESFNRLLVWLGVHGCHFEEVVVDNKKGFRPDERGTSSLISGSCSYVRPAPVRAEDEADSQEKNGTR